MNSNIRKTILASAITALIAVPAWAASDAPKAGSDTPTTAAPGAAGSAQSPTGQREGATSGMSSKSGADASSQARASTPKSPLYSRTADELEGMDVVDGGGDKIGTVDSIVTTSDRSEAHAVISVGGVLGMGAKKVLLSLDELSPAGEDKLTANATEKELDARTEYDKEQYVELEGDRMIGESVTEFSAFEPKGDATQRGMDDASTRGTGDAGMKRDSSGAAGQDMQDKSAPATPNQ